MLWARILPSSQIQLRCARVHCIGMYVWPTVWSAHKSGNLAAVARYWLGSSDGFTFVLLILLPLPTSPTPPPPLLCTSFHVVSVYVMMMMCMCVCCNIIYAILCLRLKRTGSRCKECCEHGAVVVITAIIDGTALYIQMRRWSNEKRLTMPPSQHTEQEYGCETRIPYAK